MVNAIRITLSNYHFIRRIYKVLRVAVAASLFLGFVLSIGCARNESLPAGCNGRRVRYRSSKLSALSALARFHPDDFSTRADKEVTAVWHVEVLMRSEVAPATRTAEAPLCYICRKSVLSINI